MQNSESVRVRLVFSVCLRFFTYKGHYRTNEALIVILLQSIQLFSVLEKQTEKRYKKIKNIKHREI